MNRLLIFLGSVFIALSSALPSDRWPNVLHDKPQLVVISPTTEHTAVIYHHDIAPKKDTIFHHPGIGQIYPPPLELPGPPPSPKKQHNRYDEKVLRKHYNDYLNKKVAFKKNLIEKAVVTTVDVAAKLAQKTVDFVSRIAIDTAAKLAKGGAKNVIHKKQEKLFIPTNHHGIHY
ncbi:unnamed protein product [Ceutorhynchus assimilis]|uniref:Uncharacterized protein n=1 Tax=Ceutorhynchus assimilis TaxID=467358 RepID=A0A9N9MKL1_9CUCU|nr:unnamed protein product [Ceutorhynchus assimilis]